MQLQHGNGILVQFECIIFLPANLVGTIEPGADVKAQESLPTQSFITHFSIPMISIGSI